MSRRRILSASQNIELHLRVHQLQQFTLLVIAILEVLLKQLN